mmetsp:Transcript_1348/g.4159  ORF Transcript_1348/g.4159 Transcript_1348/m.4159 type:complete len:298 (-) Transcript_1348:3680-4573(-)
MLVEPDLHSLPWHGPLSLPPRRHRLPRPPLRRCYSPRCRSHIPPLHLLVLLQPRGIQCVDSLPYRRLVPSRPGQRKPRPSPRSHHHRHLPVVSPRGHLSLARRFPIRLRRLYLKLRVPPTLAAAAAAAAARSCRVSQRPARRHSFRPLVFWVLALAKLHRARRLRARPVHHHLLLCSRLRPARHSPPHARPQSRPPSYQHGLHLCTRIVIVSTLVVGDPGPKVPTWCKIFVWPQMRRNDVRFRPRVPVASFRARPPSRVVAKQRCSYIGRRLHLLRRVAWGTAMRPARGSTSTPPMI